MHLSDVPSLSRMRGHVREVVALPQQLLLAAATASMRWHCGSVAPCAPVCRDGELAYDSNDTELDTTTLTSEGTPWQKRMPAWRVCTAPRRMRSDPRP